MLLMVEKSIKYEKYRGGICHSICWYAKTNNNYMKDYDNNRESLYNYYWDVNNFYDWAMSQKIPVLEDTSQLNEDLMKDFILSWCSMSWKITWTS